MSVKELLENQQEIRNKLINIARLKQKTFATMAKEIGVSEKTIGTFLTKEENVRLHTLFKIINYIERLERE